MVCSSVNRTDPVQMEKALLWRRRNSSRCPTIGLSLSALEFSVSCSQEPSQNDRRPLCLCYLPLLYAVQDVVATLFDERGRVVSSSCHAVPCGRSVDLERMRKLEIQDVRRIRKEINYLNLLFGLLECSNN